MRVGPAYNRALAALTAHDATMEFVLLRDCGETIECIAAARASFIASCTSSMIEDLIDACDGDKEAVVAHILQHAGLTRWQMFKVGVKGLFSKDCKHMPSKVLPI